MLLQFFSIQASFYNVGFGNLIDMKVNQFHNRNGL